MRRTRRTFLAIAAVFVLVPAASRTPAYADAITRVKGVVTDIQGKPMPKVKVWLEAVDIKKKVGPLTTGKDGSYVIAALDTSVAKKWRVYPDLPGYKVVKEYAEIVDYQKDERFKGDLIPGSKQEFPELTFVLIGDEGHNLVNIVVAKDADFLAAVQAERKKKEGAATEASAVAPGGTTAPAGTQPAGATGGSGAGEASKIGGEGLKKAKDLADAGRHSEAIEGYRAYLAKDPAGNPAVYFYLGKSLFATEDDAGAAQAYRKAIQLMPDMKWAHFGLGNVLLKEGNNTAAEEERKQNYKEAAEEFEKEANIQPDNDKIWFQLGKAYTLAGEDDKAIAALEKASLIDPSKSDSYMELASIYEKRKDKAKADEMYQKIIAVDPGNAATVFFNIGVHAWNENKDKEAAQAFQKAIEIDPKLAGAHRELARVLTRMQAFDDAVKHYQEYLRLEPKAPDAKEIQEMIVALKK
ncbi:MAG: hypothetical protein AUG09_00240 [Acidobacteria bacterium 13_1_20CM_2_68_7]|nr:MAG: hypothetical protein AUG09_00240 [Acidobacteria bacterium 13_1_20CM_2_68_7]